MTDDKTALSYWFPLIERSGLPVPKTIQLKMPNEAQKEIFSVLWGEPSDLNHAKRFFGEVANAAEPFGYPFFLRTDHTSGKHSWENTCHVASAGDIGNHVIAIAEFSECADMIGLPWTHWVVREFLPTIPVGTCPQFGNMPVCREFRFFVDDGAVRCWHPYWPLNALKQGGSSSAIYKRAAICDELEETRLRELAASVGRAVPGSWSVDILETERGWFVTDMAEADRSFHWEGCPYASKPT